VNLDIRLWSNSSRPTPRTLGGGPKNNTGRNHDAHCYRTLAVPIHPGVMTDLHRRRLLHHGSKPDATCVSTVALSWNWCQAGGQARSPTKAKTIRESKRPGSGPGRGATVLRYGGFSTARLFKLSTVHYDCGWRGNPGPLTPCAGKWRKWDLMSLRRCDSPCFLHATRESLSTRTGGGVDGNQINAFLINKLSRRRGALTLSNGRLSHRAVN